MGMFLLILCAGTLFFHWRTVRRWKREAEELAESRGFKKGYQMGIAYGRESADFWKEEE